MEEICRLVPMNPHPSEVVAKKVVKRVARQETEAVWDPVSLVGLFIIVRLGPLAKVAYSLCTFFVRTGPNPQCDSIKSVTRVLL